LYGPHSIAIDGSGSAWIVNFTSDQAIAIVELSTSGSVLSGASGLLKNGPYYSDAIAVDCSGDVWVTAYGNRVIEMVGVASPVVTPLVVGLDNNMLGTRP
jgi:hypothetical protein